MSAQLSQEEIDRLFRERTGAAERKPETEPAARYDFRRPDRIPKEQLRAIHLMHDFFARNLASSLGAYLRAYVGVSLVSVEQLSFGEFLQYLPAPTLVTSVSMNPMDGSSVLEVNPSLVMPMLDILLGGAGEALTEEVHELTEIEQSIAEAVLRVVLRDLREAWAPVAEIDFSVDGIETQPQLMQILSANEAVVAIGFEVTLGESRGMMNFGVPSILVKMIGQRFEQQWSMRRRTSQTDEGRTMAPIVEQTPVTLRAQIRGESMPFRSVLDLEVGDLISLERPIREPVEVRVNEVAKFSGRLVSVGRRAGVRLVDSPDSALVAPPADASPVPEVAERSA